MDANGLRRAFLDFFAQRAHTAVPSSGLIPHHPSAPMFTNSGMMQFVPYFIGEEAVPYSPPRAASVQKCVRAGGKHNDLDAIGRSLRHLSFFEMLGNFSFGDYFKEDAIRWAWELYTEVLGLDGDRMWATVHVSDDEAEAIWRDTIGLPSERIQRLDKDNFWEMGETGPCGPSSEIFWDYGPEAGAEGGPAHGGEERYVEIWNLVFTQYFRHPDGHLSDLPKRNVDTGAGLERNLAVLAGTRSLYDTDVLAALVEEAQSVTGARLGGSEHGDVALRLLADHARTTTFLVNDGVIPSNEDRGYVLRRILRRAVRFAYLLGVERPVLPTMVERVVDVMGDAYPDLRDNAGYVVGIIGREEERFRRTLTTGSTILDNQLAALADGDPLPGRVAFQLHDTYGFPLEVTQEVAAERGVGVDVAGFDEAMAEQRARARAAQKGAVLGDDEATAWQEVLDQFGTTEFVGREELETKARVLAVVGDSVFLDRSPFYAEAGGQVGDTGWITTDTGRARVVDTTYALPGLHRHRVEVAEGEVRPGQEAVAAIDVERRDAIRRNHTGTHILHWALRQVLGDHVKQQGSYVAPDRLRFDFSHYGPIADDDLARIEDLANHEILSNAPVRHYETSIEHARDLGAIAFFGEKYGEVVRVLEAGHHSVELCGGTHVRALGDIGPLKVVAEQSIGANLRRIEAVTGTGPIERLREEERRLAEVAELLNVPPDDVVRGVEKLREEQRALREELKELRRRAATGQAAGFAAQAVDGVVVARVDGIAPGDLRTLAIAVRDQPGVRAVVLGGAPGTGGAALVAAVRKDAGLVASDLIREAARTVKGGGGPSPEVAVAGGKDPSRLDEALDQARAAAGIPLVAA
ncbi:MAG TPA: alanine--tRNA ligase [Acidimicrobiales bacterium]|jgi:alanyl-tRNA synthetase